MKKLLLAICFCGALASYAQTVPASRHVWVVTEENHSYESTVASMPYLMSLASQYGYAQQYYSDMHNSISALMHLTAGQTVTIDDNTSLYFNVDNIIRQLLLKGMTWRAYQESLPSAGDQVLSAYPYVKRHDPLSYFTDTDTPTQWFNEVPYTQLATDFAAGVTYDYNYVTPNLLDDAHDGTLGAADTWLQQQLPAILARPEFQAGGDGIMFITFDEGDLTTDNRCSATVSTGCGGRVLTVVIGPKVNRKFVSTTWHNHESLLKTVCLALGISSCPGAAATAQPMAEFFQASASQPVVTLSAPTANATVNLTFTVNASATDASHPVTGWAIYVDNVGVYSTPGPTSSISVPVTVAAGTHALHLRAWDSSGAYGDAYDTIDAVSGKPVVTISSPAPASTVGSPVTISASATDAAHPVTGWAVYLDGTTIYSTPGPTNSISTSASVSTGTHNLTVRAWDSSGAWGDQSESFAVGSTQTTCTPGTTSPSVTICSPAANATVASPVHMVATTTDTLAVKVTQIYVDGAKAYEILAPSLDTYLSMGTGQHRVTVQAIDSASNVFNKTIYITVGSTL